MKKNYIYLVLCLFVFIGCASNNVKRSPDTSNDSQLDGVPIISYARGYMPVVELITNTGNTLHMEFDSGCTYNVLFKSGIEKAGFENIHDELYDLYRTYYPDMNDKEIKSTADVAYNSGKLISKLYDLSFDDKNISETEFYLQPKVDESKFDVDGLIGINFFNQNNNLTIDYKNNRIYINTDIKSSNYTDMYYSEVFGIYKIRADLGGMSDCFIDTGCQTVIKASTENILSDEEILELTKSKDKTWSIQAPKKLILTVNNYKREVKAYKSNMLFYKGNDARIFGRYYNILGYPAFKDKVITMDFENNKFYID